MSKRKRPKGTPIRSSLEEDSLLQERVLDGLQAVEKGHRKMISSDIQGHFVDSLDLDKATLLGHEQEHRWDYLLGHDLSGSLVALEPHSATDKEINTVIKKKRAARDQLRGQLKPGKGVARWLWVASGKVGFSPMGKARLRLYQEGIDFVGARVLPKHLRDL